MNGINLKNGWLKRKSSKFTVNVPTITKSRKLQLAEIEKKYEVTFHMMTNEKRDHNSYNSLRHCITHDFFSKKGTTQEYKKAIGKTTVK
jgi:hypothetical protein